MSLNVFIAYCSPAGSTRHAAEMINEAFSARNVPVHTFDIGKDGTPDGFIKQLTEAGSRALLFVGSPVYSNMAIPPVTGFIDRLPHMIGTLAVPFVTWGQACSGIALWQMGQLLNAKGLGLAAAAKILGVHSMMWKSDHPAGQGHPDQNDRALLDQLVEHLITADQAGTLSCLEQVALDYQPEELARTMKPKVNDAFSPIAKSINQDSCTQCGLCAEVCPVSAIILNPFPEFQPNCFGCFNCVRECPVDAIIPAVTLSQLEVKILNRIETIQETPGSQIFLP